MARDPSSARFSVPQSSLRPREKNKKAGRAPPRSTPHTSAHRKKRSRSQTQARRQPPEPGQARHHGPPGHGGSTALPANFRARARRRRLAHGICPGASLSGRGPRRGAAGHRDRPPPLKNSARCAGPRLRAEEGGTTSARHGGDGVPPPRPAKLHRGTPVTELLGQAGEAEARPHAPLHVPSRPPFRYGHSGQTSRERGTRRSHLGQPNRARRCSRGRGRGKAAAGSKKPPAMSSPGCRPPRTRPTAENAAPAEAGGPRLRAGQVKARHPLPRIMSLPRLALSR